MSIGLELGHRLSLAYWPNPELNESARTEAGDAVVDKLTLHELNQFFTEVTAGPTYCMVRRRFIEQLNVLFHYPLVSVANEALTSVKKLATETDRVLQGILR